MVFPIAIIKFEAYFIIQILILREITETKGFVIEQQS